MATVYCLQHLPKNVTYTRRLEKEMATPPVFFLRTPQTEEPGRLRSLGLQELDMTWQPRERETEEMDVLLSLAVLTVVSLYIYKGR